MKSLPAERYAGDVSAALLPALVAAGLLNLDALREALGRPLGEPIGYRRDGRPIYPIAGGDDAALDAAINGLSARIAELAATKDGSVKAEDVEAMVKAQLAKVRQPSSAAAAIAGEGRTEHRQTTSAHPGLKAFLGDGYEPGSFITAVMQSRSSDVGEQLRGKATLSAMNLHYADAPEMSAKATLGDHRAHGWLRPAEQPRGHRGEACGGHHRLAVHHPLPGWGRGPGRGPAVPHRSSDPDAGAGLGLHQGERG